MVPFPCKFFPTWFLSFKQIGPWVSSGCSSSLEMKQKCRDPGNAPGAGHCGRLGTTHGECPRGKAPPLLESRTHCQMKKSFLASFWGLWKEEKRGNSAHFLLEYLIFFFMVAVEFWTFHKPLKSDSSLAWSISTPLRSHQYCLLPELFIKQPSPQPFNTEHSFPSPQPLADTSLLSVPMNSTSLNEADAQMNHL